MLPIFLLAIMHSKFIVLVIAATMLTQLMKSMGKPQQLTKQQVEQIKKQNDGSPMLKEVITVKDGVVFSKDLDIRENDVLFLNLIKI